MRISDWSSDVCSSDLTAHFMHCASGSGNAAERWGGFARPHCCARSASGEPPGSRCCERRTLAAYHPRDWRACSRSEEHTSELQSLMRISYAVFCLTKTTTSTDL